MPPLPKFVWFKFFNCCMLSCSCIKFLLVSLHCFFFFFFFGCHYLFCFSKCRFEFYFSLVFLYLTGIKISFYFSINLYDVNLSTQLEYEQCYFVCIKFFSFNFSKWKKTSLPSFNNKPLLLVCFSYFREIY